MNAPKSVKIAVGLKGCSQCVACFNHNQRAQVRPKLATSLIDPMHQHMRLRMPTSRTLALRWRPRSTTKTKIPVTRQHMNSRAGINTHGHTGKTAVQWLVTKTAQPTRHQHRRSRRQHSCPIRNNQKHASQTGTDTYTHRGKKADP